MPQRISEISSGNQFQRSSENGQLADSQTRVFRVLLSTPDEAFDVQDECNVKIGDPHPINTNIYCVSWDAKYEGDSRMVAVCTFNYRSTPDSQGGDQKESPPDARPANWSTSTSLIEVPAASWSEFAGPDAQFMGDFPAKNPVGDMYDGVSKFEAIVTITIEQYEERDPTRHLLYAGCVNSDTVRIGSLTCRPGSLMFRGVQCKPHVESWGSRVFRGWLCSFEFAFRKNRVRDLYDAGQTYDADIGWDVAVPQTGFNVRCLINAQDVEKTGMPLKHQNGKIDPWPDAELPDDVAEGQKARALVLVHEYENGGASQLPSAQPVALNDDGSPRASTANPPVIVRRYRTNESIPFLTTFNIRLT